MDWNKPYKGTKKEAIIWIVLAVGGWAFVMYAIFT